MAVYNCETTSVYRHEGLSPSPVDTAPGWLAPMSGLVGCYGESNDRRIDRLRSRGERQEGVHTRQACLPGFVLCCVLLCLVAVASLGREGRKRGACTARSQPTPITGRVYLRQTRQTAKV